MLNVSPTIAKFIAAALAIVAVVVAYTLVPGGHGHDLLMLIAGGLVGKEALGRTGDVTVVGVHPDDVKG